MSKQKRMYQRLWLIFGFYFGLWGLSLALAEKWPAWLQVSWPAIVWCGLEYI